MQENWEDAAWLEDRDIIERTFRETFGRDLDLGNPQTFNEKIAYKMLFDRRPLLTRVADKAQARDCVAQRIGAGYLTQLYQLCRSPQEIDWQALPRSFVVKANHGSGMNAIVANKSEVDRARLAGALQHWLGINYYYSCRREWCYRDIVPSLLVEEFLTDVDGRAPMDYKFYVFDGRPAYLQLDFDRFAEHRRNLYDRALRRLNARLRYPSSDERFDFPPNVEEMFALASRLGEGFDFVRVDLYNVRGRIVFGELTHYPEEGRGVFDPPEYDGIFGAQWQIPERYQ